MNTRKIIKYILIAVPLLFLAKSGIESIIYNSNKIPDINPNPKEKLRIYGKFPFENDVDMKITVHYMNINPECDRKLLLAGTQFSQKAKKVFSTDISNGNFESNIYLDYFSQGICKWKAHEIYAYMVSKKKNILIRGGEVGGGVVIAKKDVIVSWESNWMELYNDGKITWKGNLNNQNGIKLPADIKIGTIDYLNVSSSNKIYNLDCMKKHTDTNMTKIICNGYDLKLNISSLQQETQFNFIDKGWTK